MWIQASFVEPSSLTFSKNVLLLYFLNCSLTFFKIVRSLFSKMFSHFFQNCSLTFFQNCFLIFSKLYSQLFQDCTLSFFKIVLLLFQNCTYSLTLLPLPSLRLPSSLTAPSQLQHLQVILFYCVRWDAVQSGRDSVGPVQGLQPQAHQGTGLHQV